MPNSQMGRRRNKAAKKRASGSRTCAAVAAVLAVAVTTTTTGVSAFLPVSRAMTMPATRLSLAVDDDIAQTVERAKALLEKSKAKLAAQEEKNGDTNDTSSNSSSGASVPFFASQAATSAKSDDDGSQRREQVTKSRDETTGLITADGEKMAAMSEQEQWERRPLSDVFEAELQDHDNGKSTASKRLADRDVAASIFNLRKVLQTEDFMKIFDKRNFFIGDN